MRLAPCFMRVMAAASISLVVSAVSGTWSVITSAASADVREHRGARSPGAAHFDAVTRLPAPSRRRLRADGRARRCPALSRASREPAAVLIHSPRWAAALAQGMPRISSTISASTSSATLRVFENGALKTGMPRSCAASKSTWLVPMQKQPMAVRWRAASSTPRVELCGGAIRRCKRRAPLRLTAAPAKLSGASRGWNNRPHGRRRRRSRERLRAEGFSSYLWKRMYPA